MKDDVFWMVCNNMILQHDDGIPLSLFNFSWDWFQWNRKHHLVGGDWNMTSIFPFSWEWFIPIDELIFLRGVGIPPTRYTFRFHQTWQWKIYTIFIDVIFLARNYHFEWISSCHDLPEGTTILKPHRSLFLLERVLLLSISFQMAYWSPLTFISIQKKW